MTQGPDKNAAVVVLPAVGGGRLKDTSLKSWLSRAAIDKSRQPREALKCILAALQKPYPDGLAALRMWGQTGDRPTVWIAAADPVYLEPRLDHLCLHALDDAPGQSADLRTVIDHLQTTLAQDTTYGFARIGNCGYLRASEAITTAQVPSYLIDQQLPNEFMPAGEDSGQYRNLVSEVEMAMHDHEVNDRRQAVGQPPINSVWLWGGGFAPEQCTEPLPPLFTDDPLLKGHWFSKTGVVTQWPGSIGACLEASVAGFVAAPAIPAGDVEALEACLRSLREALYAKRLSQIVLLFRDGLEVSARRAHRIRVWRNDVAWLD